MMPFLTFAIAVAPVTLWSMTVPVAWSNRSMVPDIYPGISIRVDVSQRFTASSAFASLKALSSHACTLVPTMAAHGSVAVLTFSTPSIL